MLLFIKAIAEQDWITLRMKFTIIFVIYTCALVAMIIDLALGLRKAKQRGEARTSEGLKRTIDKGVKYFSLLILFTMADIIASLTIGVPYFTMIGGLFIVGIEIKSWFEKANDKERRYMSDLIKMLESREDAISALAEILKKKEDETDK